MTSYAKAIRNARHEAGWTQADLAKRIGVGNALVSNWEREKSDPTAYLDQLEQALGPLVKTRGSLVKTRDFARWLRETREKRKLTVIKLAEEANLSSLTISNIENERTVPQKRTIAQLETVLGATNPKEKFASIDDYDDDDEGLLSSEISEFNPHDDNEIKRLMKDVKGIYLLYGQNGQPVYVGKSNNNLSKRIFNHKAKFWYKSPVIKIGYYISINDKELCDKMEGILIQLLRPLANEKHLPKE